MDSGLDLLSIICGERMADEFRERVRGRCPVHVLDNDTMEALAGFPFHRGVMAAAARPVMISLERYLSENPACCCCDFAGVYSPY